MPTEELYLQDIVNSIDAVKRFLNGVEKSKFLADEILQNAVLMKLVVIGEASARLSNEIRNRYLEVEWKAIIGFRNISVHAYFSVNF